MKKGHYHIWPSPCEEDLSALKRVVSGEKYHRVNHPLVMELEQRLADWSGLSVCRVMNTGTSAIHTGAAYLSQRHGIRKAVVSALNWPSAVAPVYMAGMEPVYVDVELNSGCMAEKNVLEEFQSSSMVLVTHLFGNVAYLPDVRKQAAESEQMVILDDCSQGMGISRLLSSERAEVHTDCVAFSGNGAKHLAAGELGIIMGNEEELLKYVDYISLSSSSRNGERVFSPFTKGYNYRPNVFSCAIAIYRLETMTEQLAGRWKNSVFLWEQLNGLKGLHPIFSTDDKNANFYGAPFRVDPGELDLPDNSGCRDYIVDLLSAEGLPVSVWLKKPVWEYLDYNRTNCDLTAFPNTKRLLDTMFTVTEIAEPNNRDIMLTYASAFHKVWSFLEERREFALTEIEQRIKG